MPILILLLTILWGCLNPYSSDAAPAITGASGSFSHMSSVTVSGSGFGTKSTAAPLLWDPVDGMYDTIVDGAAVPVGGNNPWPQETYQAYSPVRFITTDARGKWTSKYRNSDNAPSPDTGNGCLGGLNFPTATSYLYISWWTKPDATQGSGAASNKFFRLTDNAQWDDATSGAIWEPNNFQMFGNAAGLSNGVTFYYSGYYNEYQTVNAWNRNEVLVDNTTTPHPTVYLWVNNTMLHNSCGVTNELTWTAQSGDGCGTDGGAQTSSTPDPITGISSIGADWSNTAGGYANLHFGEFYVDDTRQRVEICSGSTWAAKGTCEIQIPHTTWGNTSLQITVNQGAFADSSTNYLYVVDAAGDANANGTEITFGAGASDTTPPSTTITTGSPIASSTGSATIEGTATDDTAVTGVKCRIGAEPDANNGTACTGTTSWSCAVSGLASGENTVYCEAYDAAGNYDSGNTITANYTPPTATVTGVTFTGVNWQ